ncbi:PAS domain-containing protein [Yoonia sp.]|uniref:PAS domain S-box protein n=1 Tax=Yoonia sp. TaxID=2212373 RepID=UPI003F6AAA10
MPSTIDVSFDDDRNRAIYDVVQSFIGLISPDGILLHANRSALDFIGMELEDVVATPFFQTPWWRDCQTSQDAVKDAVRRGASGTPSRFEARHSGKNGEIIDVDFSLTPIFGKAGGVDFLVPEARDITEIKKAVNALYDTEARLSFAYDAAEIGSWDLDLATNRLHWSDQQFDLFGIAKTSGQMTFERAIASIHPEDRDRVVALTRQSVENSVSYRDEFRVIRADGQIRWVVARGKPLHCDENGKPASMIGVNYDVTDRKNAEFALAKINQDLTARVAERTRDLEQEMQERQKAQEALSHALRLEAIGQLAGGMAHDFNNLLAVICGNLEIAAMKIKDDDVIALIKDALVAVEAGSSLNQRLLSFAQKRSLCSERLSIGDRIRYSKMLLERSLDKNIALEIDISDTEWETFIDPGEFDSALLNICINARDAMPSGGKLRIATRNRTLKTGAGGTIPSTQTGDYVQLSISDTGVGMTPEVRDKAMTPFFTTKAPGKGSGLGLSSVFGFANQSGGFVTIDSVVGAGTTIDVYLPRAPAQSNGRMPVSANADMPMGKGELVLMVEDSDALLRINRARLARLGYKVITAGTAAEAVQILEKDEPVSLVFSDVSMPGEMSGFGLAAWLSENRPDIRILLTSGYSQSVADTQGHPKLLAKPYTINTLAVSLRDALA